MCNEKNGCMVNNGRWCSLDRPTTQASLVIYLSEGCSEVIHIVPHLDKDWTRVPSRRWKSVY